MGRDPWGLSDGVGGCEEGWEGLPTMHQSAHSNCSIPAPGGKVLLSWEHPSWRVVVGVGADRSMTRGGGQMGVVKSGKVGLYMSMRMK